MGKEYKYYITRLGEKIKGASQEGQFVWYYWFYFRNKFSKERRHP
jgi:hypothetical protein